MMNNMPPFLLVFISAKFALLLAIFPFVGSCLSQENLQVGNHNSLQQQKAGRKAVEIEVHGILLWASMGFLMPAGILIIRIAACTKEQDQTTKFKIFYYIHATFQVIGVVLATIAAVVSIRSFENSFKNCHQRLGLALYAAIYLQFFIGYRRPKRGTQWRRVWYFCHWLVGITTSLMGIINTYLGLKAYNLRTSKSSTVWSIVFTAQVCLMALLYLLQDKWNYIQNQGILQSCNEEEIIVVATQTNRSTITIEDGGNVIKEPRRKSNSLGAYFVKYNALNKLFQLT